MAEESEARALVHLAVGTEGELELVIAEEVWNVLKKAMEEENAAAAANAAAPPEKSRSVVRVSLQRMTDGSLTPTATPGNDQPPCPPLKVRNKP